MKAFAAIALSSIFIFVLSGCAEDVVVNPPPPDIPIEQLLSYPDTILVEGRNLWLDTYMWRDFMPISPPGGKPLYAIMIINAVDTMPFPSSVNSDAVWIVYNNQVWSSWLSDQPGPPHNSNCIEKRASDGPKWGPCDSCASAVVRIYDSNNTAHYLLAKDKNIGRSE